MMVPGETVVVEKEVVRTVEVPGETVVVEKQVPVEVVKTVQVPVEVVKTVEVPGPERVVVKEVAGKKYVTDPTTGKVVVAPEYGGTMNINGFEIATNWPPDPYFNWGVITVSGVVEKLGIGNWGIDRGRI